MRSGPTMGGRSRLVSLLVVLLAGCPVPEDACTLPSDEDHDGISLPTDCDDADSAVHPWADEACNGKDDDCDGVADEADAVDAATWYADADGDGFGDLSTPTTACEAPDGFVGDATDCDDGDSDTHPAADEFCDHHDDDCDGAVDEDALDPSPWYADDDGDGWGDAAASTTACEAPAGFVGDATDCDDDDPAVNPGAVEVCGNDVDDDCDGGAGVCGVGDRHLEGADAQWTGAGGYGDLLNGHEMQFTGPGDVDGDGFDDILIGTPNRVRTSEGTRPGAVSVVRGSAAPVGGSLADVDGVLWGEQSGDLAGIVAAAGDLDMDGLADVYIGAPDHDVGVVYVVPGSALLADAIVTDVALATYTGESGFQETGARLAGAGDVNGDGAGDLLVSTYWNASPGDGDWVVKLVLGSDPPADRSLADAIPFLGVQPEDSLGFDLAGAGDVNGDAFDDLLIPEFPNMTGGPGIVYLVLGSPSPDGGSLADADVALSGQDRDQAGWSVAGGGDVNADGYTDMLIGAVSHRESGDRTGAVYIVFGSPLPVSRSLADADALILGVGEDGIGHDVAFAGDVDADGFDDVLVGGIDSQTPRAVHLFLGSTLPAVTSLEHADARIYRSTDYWGEARADGAGDVNGDGRDDVLVGWEYLHQEEAAVALFMFTGL
jgi:hypothetical protein